MQGDIRELIAALRYCSVRTVSCKGCPRYEDDADCAVDIKREAAEALEQYVSLINTKDVIIDDLNKRNLQLEQENCVLWRKEEAMATEDERCPVCGKMQFVDGLAYCKWCGQLLKFEGALSPSVSDGSSGPSETPVPTDDTEIGMITNINDRM